ncbi:MAG: redox-sensing transcriptional repressor Rex [Dehalococcoidia bacterium]|nr:redox-sensing transcriptional repressor Rex [Dehalococcoidia bacterium]
MAGRSVARQAGPGGVPEVVVMRLPQYIRVLSSLMAQGVNIVSSQRLGEILQVTPAQIRKDLSYFGRFGKQGRGYRVRHLIMELKEIMGLDRRWNVVLVGVGRLGRAVLSYPGFAPEGFHVVAAFDADRRIIGRTVGNLKVQPVEELDETVMERGIGIGIVGVPGPHAQGVVDRLVGAGVKAILNYAPIAAQAPDGVKVRNVDPVLALQTMTFYLLGEDDEA